MLSQWWTLTACIWFWVIFHVYVVYIHVGLMLYLNFLLWSCFKYRIILYDVIQSCTWQFTISMKCNINYVDRLPWERPHQEPGVLENENYNLPEGCVRYYVAGTDVNPVPFNSVLHPYSGHHGNVRICSLWSLVRKNLIFRQGVASIMWQVNTREQSLYKRGIVLMSICCT